jgi:hypothetical protein
MNMYINHTGTRIIASSVSVRYLKKIDTVCDSTWDMPKNFLITAYWTFLKFEHTITYNFYVMTRAENIMPAFFFPPGILL